LWGGEREGFLKKVRPVLGLADRQEFSRIWDFGGGREGVSRELPKKQLSGQGTSVHWI
jgi:hypothetical protein